MEEQLTPLEKLLKEQMPEIWTLYLLSKPAVEGGGGEINLWPLIEQILTINQNMQTGIVFINFSKGRIDNISYKHDILAFKGKRNT